MFPLKDDLVSRSAPVMTVSIVTLNVLVFLYQTSLQLGISLEVDNPPHALETAQAFVLEFGLIPCRLMDLCAFPEDLPAPLFTIFSSMFLHGGFLHVGGNMLYLWIFGKNVEDTLGHARFTLFYLVAGVAAALTQVLASPASEVPMIGASGAVSGVLGAYLILFPQSRVLTSSSSGSSGAWSASRPSSCWGSGSCSRSCTDSASSGRRGAWPGSPTSGASLRAGMGLLFVMRPGPSPAGVIRPRESADYHFLISSTIS